jgi:hypothetical protein
VHHVRLCQVAAAEVDVVLASRDQAEADRRLPGGERCTRLGGARKELIDVQRIERGRGCR